MFAERISLTPGGVAFCNQKIRHSDEKFCFKFPICVMSQSKHSNEPQTWNKSYNLTSHPTILYYNTRKIV